MICFDILTLFPKLCAGSFTDSILKKAQENLLIQVRCLNIRDWATDKHHVTDEPPYGGGPGMVMKPEPIFAAVESIRTERSHVILMAPGGRRFTQEDRLGTEPERTSHFRLRPLRRNRSSSQLSIWQTMNFPSATTCSPMVPSPPR